MAQLHGALEAADAATFERAAHTLKGAAANFGNGPLVECAFRLEQLGRAGELAPATAALPELRHELGRFEAALIALRDGAER